MRRTRSEKLRDVVVAQKETGRGEGHAISHPPQPPVAQASIHPCDSLLAAQPYDVFIVYALGLPQPEEDRLAPHFTLAEDFRELRLALAGDVAMNVARVREAAIADERMRSDAEAEVLLASPVAKIVAALLTGTREVADLVLRETGLRESFDGQRVEIGDEVVVGKRYTFVFHLPRERCALFQIEHVERDVTGACGDGSVQRLFETRRSLPR